MRSRRRLLETGCRLAAFALLGWLLGIALTPSAERRTERADASMLATALPAWTRSGGHVAMHADLDVVPGSWTIDWLSALRRAGRPVSWSGSPPVAAISVEPAIDPAGGARIDVVAPRDSRVVLSDEVSSIDSLRVGALGASVETPVVVGTPTARIGQQMLSAGGLDSVRFGAVVVVGRASWEGKYAVAALEERGWRVVGRWSVAPTVDVAQGALAFDTSDVSAVVALDSSVASLAAAIERFVRSGGGLVLAGSAGLAPALASLAPSAAAQRIAPRAATSDTLDRASAGFYALTALRRDAIPLERRDDRVAVAARRVGAGRVIQIGFDESWRWRMAGALGAEAAHRAWWSRIVGSVAYAPSVQFTLRHPEQASAGSASSTMSAPLASLVDRVGLPRTDAPASFQRWSPNSRILLILMLSCLLVEWVSRRLRGAR